MKKFNKILLVSMLGFSSLSPSLVLANESSNKSEDVEDSITEVNTKNYKMTVLKQRAIDIDTEIKNTILKKGYLSVEDYNSEIGITIPLEESVYYNNTLYYSTPLPETLENADVRYIRLISYAKELFRSSWVRNQLTDFGKMIVAGAAGAIGVTVVDSTMEIMINGLPKISTQSSSDVVGYGRITSGGKVKVAQMLLREQGYNIAVDGIWGPKSEEATKSFQRSLGLTADGIIGKHTWAYLIEYLN